MVDFVLNNLCRPTLVVLGASLHIQGLILDLDGLIAFALTGATEQRETSLFGIVRLILFEDDRVEHYGICRSSSAFVQECDDALSNTYHICCHTNTGLSVSHQGLKEVVGNTDIQFQKVHFPMEGTPSGIVMEVRLLHS